MNIPDTLLPEEWEQNHLGDLICPCGHTIELDGKCPNGHVSPIREQGLI